MLDKVLNPVAIAHNLDTNVTLQTLQVFSHGCERILEQISLSMRKHIILAHISHLLEEIRLG